MLDQMVSWRDGQGEADLVQVAGDLGAFSVDAGNSANNFAAALADCQKIQTDVTAALAARQLLTLLSASHSVPPTQTCRAGQVRASAASSGRTPG